MRVTKSDFTRKKLMQIVPHTISTHKKICTDLEIFSSYDEAQHQSNNIGGDTHDDSKNHLLARYLNSAARTQIAVKDYPPAMEQIYIEIAAQLYEGNLYIIDIAAGHGAGTTSILNSICKLREENSLTRNRLNIQIHAIDYSIHSLEFYERIILDSKEFHEKQGINITINKHQIDITKDEELNCCINKIKVEIGNDPRFLLTTSAITGVKRCDFEAYFQKSYATLTSNFRSNNSTFFWVEPRHRKMWIENTWKILSEQEEKEYETDNANALQVDFSWEDPYNKNPIDTGAAYFLLGLNHG